MDRRGGKASVTTVDKALSLLDHFSNEQTEIGLSAFARLAGYDKSAVLRMLSALGRAGFVEQDPQSRKYRLGGAFLRFARLREATFPLIDLLRPFAMRLNEATSETVHISHFAGSRLSTILVIDSPRTTRVHVNRGMTLPLNATASGLCWLAFSAPDIREDHLSATQAQYQEGTLTDRASIEAHLEGFQATGYSLAERSFDSDVTSVAVPIFGMRGEVLACLSVAAVASRMTPEIIERNSQLAVQIAVEATFALGATPPSTYPGATSRSTYSGATPRPSSPEGSD